MKTPFVLKTVIGIFVALAKLRVVLIDAVFCSLAGLLTWSFVLGADPRKTGENRHLTVILAAVLYGFVVGTRLLFSGRFRPSLWLFVRAGQLAAGIGLIQLATEHQQAFVQLAAGGVGILVLTAGLLASFRVLANSRPHKTLDVLLVYGSFAAALVFAGSYHARSVTLEVTFEQGVSLATLRVRHWFGLAPAETKQLRDVRTSEFASAADGGGSKLIGAGDQTLIVPGDPSVGQSICFKVATELADFLEGRQGTFSAEESHLNLFWWYALAALALLVIGWRWDTLCEHLALTEDGRRDASIFATD